MTLFLDTEFNEFGGALISIALVSDDCREGSEFYEVRDLPTNPTPFVKEHVIPVLEKEPVPDTVLQKALLEYLNRHAGQIIIADWNEDLIHLLPLLSASPGWAYRIPLTLRLINAGPLQSDVPHNALHDARALRHWYQQIHG